MSTELPQDGRRARSHGRVARGVGALLGRTLGVVVRPYRTVARLVASRRGSRTRQGGGGLRAARIGRPERDAASGPGARAERETVSFQAAHIAADEGLAALSQALSDPDPAVRMLAVAVICELSGERAARLLSGVLHDPDAKVRGAAAEAVARIQADGAVFSLILALDDPVDEVQQAAARAIEVVTGRPVPFVGSDEESRRRRGLEEMKTWWKEQRFAQLVADSKVGAIR